MREETWFQKKMLKKNKKLSAVFFRGNYVGVLKSKYWLLGCLVWPGDSQPWHIPGSDTSDGAAPSRAGHSAFHPQVTTTGLCHDVDDVSNKVAVLMFFWMTSCLHRILNKFLDNFEEDELPWHESIEPCLSSMTAFISDREVRRELGWEDLPPARCSL